MPTKWWKESESTEVERHGDDPCTDDLIQVLTSKGILNVTDLPAAAQAKLMDRNQARETLGGLSDLINDDETRLI